MNCFSVCNPDRNLPAPERLVDPPAVALVSMPWASLSVPSLALGVLKPCAEAAGFAVDVFHLQLRFAQLLGAARYETIAAGAHMLPEWFFSFALFGPPGLGELRNSMAEMKADPLQSAFPAELAEATGETEESCAEIATDCVPRFIDQCIAEIAWDRYLAVGFTNSVAQCLASLLLAKRIKELSPAVNIILGGANVEGTMGVEILRACPWIDYVVHGQGERSFPRLLENLANSRPFQAVPGVSLRSNGSVLRGDMCTPARVDWTDWPVPDHSDYLRSLQAVPVKRREQIWLPFQSSRGCWWGARNRCAFCAYDGNFGSFLAKPPSTIAAEVASVARRFRCLRWYAIDSALPNEFYEELLPLLATLDADLQIFYEIRPRLTRRQALALRSARVTRVQAGIEALTTSLLRRMNKGATAIDNIQALKLCAESGIAVKWNLLCGVPGESPEDYESYPELFRSLAHLPPPDTLHAIIFQRFSPYFANPAQYGLVLRPMRAYRSVFPPSRFDLEKVAYFFEGSWDGQAGDPRRYTEPARRALREWQATWRAGGGSCVYHRGPGYCAIVDRRPLTNQGRTGVRRVSLGPEMSELLTYCDEHKSFQSICRHTRTALGPRVTDAEIGLWLDILVRERWLFREGERYLSLPLRGRP